MREIVAMTEKLKQDLPIMLEDHKQIVKELYKLIEVAKREIIRKSFFLQRS